MYSIVLMMAATSAPETTNFGGLFRGGCQGCYSSCHGFGGCYGGCYGGSSAACYGSSHHGCWGGRAQHAWGGCSASLSVGYGSCYGSCYGSGRGHAYWGGSCHGYGIYGGSCLGASPPHAGYGYGMPQYVPQGTYVPPAGDPALKAEPIPLPKRKDGKDTTGSIDPTPTRAAVTIKLPADARLYAEGQLTALAGEERNFLTPNLQVERPYRYTLKVEYNRQGKTVSESRDVIVKAGERTTVEFKDAAVAAKPADPTLTASK